MGITRKGGRVRKRKTSITDIPEHVLMTILSKCSPATLLQASAVCKQFHTLCRSNTLWRPLYQQKFTEYLLAGYVQLPNDESEVDPDNADECVDNLSLLRLTKQASYESAAVHYDSTVSYMNIYRSLELATARYRWEDRLENELEHRLREISSLVESLSLWNNSLREWRIARQYELSRRQREGRIPVEVILNSRSFKQSGGRVLVPRRKDHRERELVDAGHLAKVRKLRKPWLMLARRKL